METIPKSLGQDRVRVDFNVNGDDNVTLIKKKSAKLIDICESLKPQDGSMMSSEKARLIALAQTAYEEAAMWAVKAATY
jgi:hypothetical protein